ncbi:MAG: S9 family peptidase [Candidatus Sumerlaeota bacterium]|nr:S9 family peptidase [Candidatus Sumerlaeota bacterium]
MAELPPLIPRETLFGNPVKASPRISPDGKMLVFLAPYNGVLNVWVRSLGAADDRVITSDKKRGIHNAIWRGDSAHVLYKQDSDGDENWHVYMTETATSVTRDLTPFSGIQARVEAIDPKYPNEMLVSMNIRDRKLHDVYRVDLNTGAVVLDTENPGDVSSWTADNKLQIRASESMLPDGGTLIRTRSNHKTPWRFFTSWGPDESFGGVAAFTSNNRSVYLISSVDANASRLMEVNPQTSKTRIIAEDPEYDVSGIMTHPATHALQAVSFTRARQEWQIIDESLKDDFDKITKTRSGDFIINADLADRIWIVSYIQDDGPIYYYAYHRDTKKAELLFSNRPDLEKFTLAKMQPISFQSRDGLTIHGYLTLPLGVEPKNLPMVLLVHGGPWGRDSWGYDSEAQWLANRGYAVLQINFRGSAGYGKAFLNAGDREWGGKMHDDLIDSKNWAVKEGYANPSKVAIYGGSYGGYAALVGLTFTPKEFTAGIDVVGPSNLLTLIKTIPPYWEPIKAMFKKRVGDIVKDEEFLKSRSPLFKANHIERPLLIGQGANDPRVKQAESDQIAAAARKNGKEVEYLVFPDEGHGFARPENRLKFYAAAEGFLAKHLGGRAQPPSVKEKADDLRK